MIDQVEVGRSIVNRHLAQAHYNASKAGVVHLTRSLAVEWAARDIRVNALSPGYTLTAMIEREDHACWRTEWERPHR
jgi:NAD(P)-dependent dehydrogenase (short-subunit alcohol dehydrogenase family)